MTAPRWWWSTARAPGAIAVAHLDGTPADVDRVLHALTGNAAPAPGQLAWRRFGTVDDGVVARVHAGHALVMPHGGPRIRTRMDELAAAAGAHPGAAPADPRATFPEAADPVEAAALAAIAHAASPLAIDLLAAQPARWRAAGWTMHAAGAHGAPGTHPPATARDHRLARLLTPPRVVVTGPANAGKSTLLNALAGRTVAIAHDAPGTTRDAVAARIELAGLVVDWFDTPGVRADPDPIEAAAAHLATRALAAADLVIALTAPGLGWGTLDGAPAATTVLRVVNKCDAASAAAAPEATGADLAISARTGEGVPALVTRVRDALVPPADRADPRPWRFA